MAITTTICAYNAEKTIGRAVSSARAAGDNPILLVDDFSDDNTVAIAAEIAGDHLTVVRPHSKLGIGNARQTALDYLETPYALWLDADDELLPDRPARLLDILETQSADLVYDSGVLVSEDGQQTPLQMPDFLRENDGHLRLIERNWLPGLWGGFRTAFAKKIGYDQSFLNSEDYDFLLRSIFAGARVRFEAKSGYRYHHTNNSLSRNLAQAVNFTGNAAEKHTVDCYQDLLKRSALSEPEQLYTLAANQMACGQYETLLQLVPSRNNINEEIRPYDQPAAQLFSFLRATALLKLAQPEAAHALLHAAQLQTPEALNNFGIALKQIARPKEAEAAFEQALACKPGYVDAIRNLNRLEDKEFAAITLLPLRPIASRSSYKA